MTPAVGESCLRCRRWIPSFTAKCSQCGTAASWRLAANVFAFFAGETHDTGGHKGAQDGLSPAEREELRKARKRESSRASRARKRAGGATP